MVTSQISYLAASRLGPVDIELMKKKGRAVTKAQGYWPTQRGPQSVEINLFKGTSIGLTRVPWILSMSAKPFGPIF